MHTKSAAMSGRNLSQNEQQTHCNRITCTYGASEEKNPDGSRKKRLSKRNSADVHHGASSAVSESCISLARALPMRLTGHAQLVCENSASAKRAEI